MIQEIGFMIGFYIITRATSLLTRTGERRESIPVWVLSVITIVITLIVIFDLFHRGVDISNLG